jgi:hypothetical protein
MCALQCDRSALWLHAERRGRAQSLTVLVLSACLRSICRAHSCGTQAILNLILNIDDATASEHGIKLGEEIKNFKEFTQCLPADVSPQL